MMMRAVGWVLVKMTEGILWLMGVWDQWQFNLQQQTRSVEA